MESIASIVAPVATSIAAFIVASNLGARITGYGFIIFTVGSIGWIVLGVATDQPNLLWQNILLTGLNVFGIWRWLGRQARIEDGASHAASASEQAPDETLFPISLLSRAQVVCSDGTQIGTGVDAMAGCSSGRIRYVVVSEGGIAGMGERLRRLDWTSASVDGETLVAALDSDALCRLPEIDRDDWPER